MKIKTFEDLIVWQKARELTDYIYKLTAKFPNGEKYNLIDQMRRAVVSIAANIAEGFSRYHLKETIMFYRNVRGSISELKSHLYLSSDRSYIASKDLELSLLKLDEVGKLLNGLIKSTNKFRQN